MLYWTLDALKAADRSSSKAWLPHGIQEGQCLARLQGQILLSSLGPTPIEKLLCKDPLKLNSTAVEYPHISLRTRALFPPIAASALPRPPILAKHCASMQRSYTGWQLGRLVESSVSNTRSISFNGYREGHRGPWVAIQQPAPVLCRES